ncbi:MAG: 50S ribosomal protein L25 [bacterium]|nr:50S ribosomal protein L25 [bacterium]
MELSATKRDVLGRAVGKLRKEGKIPAELYGKGIENAHLSVDSKEFNKVFEEAGESTMIDLMVDGKKTLVLIQDVSEHFLTGDVIAIDFYQPKLDEEVTVSVPIVFEGESPAVKDLGGIFIPSLEELEIEVLPTEIPHEFKVDISSLKEIGDHITVKDIPMPSDKIKVLVDENTAIASVIAKMTEEEDAAMSSAADVESVEVEGEEAKEAVEGEAEGEKREGSEASKEEESKE